MTMENDDGKAEIEMLRETRFITGSKYEGTWDAIDMTGIGRYVTPYKVVLEGEFRNGMLHGHGSMYWPRGQRMDGVWIRGRMVQRRYTFADGLAYRENGWDYCVYPDRRFYKCMVNGLKPAGEVLKTNDQPTKIIPPFCYDTGAGIFDPDSNCVTSYRNYTPDSNGDRKCMDKEKLPKRLVRADWSSGMVARILAIGSGGFCNATACLARRRSGKLVAKIDKICKILAR
ncbi:MORN repeat-containing protein 5 isoform X2 [Temnothorax curvispinosus]|uniref:MORN repeat-containing protein 5 n=1 Tax=Temnothorax curvispinosus TaxID=300111 RepID=A0A6J1PIR5_9HYME|nr:MORN repeat-containing protein 5 isoform X2 [Temnothorax curvispinosus]